MARTRTQSSLSEVLGAMAERRSQQFAPTTPLPRARRRRVTLNPQPFWFVPSIASTRLADDGYLDLEVAQARLCKKVHAQSWRFRDSLAISFACDSPIGHVHRTGWRDGVRTQQSRTLGGMLTLFCS